MLLAMITDGFFNGVGGTTTVTYIELDEIEVDIEDEIEVTIEVESE